MGAISFLLYNMSNPPINIEFTKSFMNMKSRGPDDTQVTTESTPVITQTNNSQIASYLSKREIAEYKPVTFQYGYHRMSINDPSIDGSQPFDDPIVHKVRDYPELRTRPKRKLLCNGEIYNYTDLVQKHTFTDRDLQSNSDVEVILPLYIKHASVERDPELGLRKTLSELNGDFSFVITENTGTFYLKQIHAFVARDAFGTRPLYMIHYKPTQQKSTDEIFYLFVSELKGVPIQLLHSPDYVVTEVPPGTYWSYKNSVTDRNPEQFIRYFDLSRYAVLDNCRFSKADAVTLTTIYDNIKGLLTSSVTKRLHETRSLGILLSGGFDSCIILSIVVKHLLSQEHDFTKDPLHVFTIGHPDSTDVINAIQHVDTLEKTYNIDIHHHVISIQNIETVVTEITRVIQILETYDCKTIRQSIPLLYLLQYIQKTDVKILLSGDGLDEICGYHSLFNLTDQHFQAKSIEMLTNLHRSDLLRCDKLAESCGLEMRFPFLDVAFVEYMLEIHPLLKRPQMSAYSRNPVEKYIVRKAFDNNSDTIQDFYIDKRLLWTPKRDIESSFKNFSSILTDYCNNLYNDIDYENFQNTHTHSLVDSKEAMHYIHIFEKLYPNTLHICESVNL